MTAPALTIQNLEKKYKDTTAVRGVSFMIHPGEFFGFLGPNGAGKTSTIKCIVGIAAFSGGTIEVFGKDVVSEYREARKLIGFSPQEFNMDVFIKVRDLLLYVAGYYGIAHKERTKKVEELLGRFDLIEHADKPFRALSGGLKRRVVLARALVHDPDLIILDEPTAGVDVSLRHELWRYFKELNEAGKTIFLTSHYLEEVEMLANRIAIINKGNIVAIGDKKEFVGDGKKLEHAYLELTKNVL
ncbi:MAG TPA: ABC transporter ATP-binding protein [Candidatus Paceibacterota bacterium]